MPATTDQSNWNAKYGSGSSPSFGTVTANSMVFNTGLGTSPWTFSNNGDYTGNEYGLTDAYGNEVIYVDYATNTLHTAFNFESATNVVQIVFNMASYAASAAGSTTDGQFYMGCRLHKRIA